METRRKTNGNRKENGGIPVVNRTETGQKLDGNQGGNRAGNRGGNRGEKRGVKRGGNDVTWRDEALRGVAWRGFP